MLNTENLMRQLYSALLDISHPIEGTFYLFLLAVIFRWQWPGAWNDFLKSISAPVKKSWSNEKTSKVTPPEALSEKTESNKSVHDS